MEGMLTAVQNIAEAIPAFSLLTHMFCWFSGFAFFISGFVKFARLKQSAGRDNNVNIIVTQLVIGTLLMALPVVYNALMTTMFGKELEQNASTIFAYAPATVGLFEAEEPRAVITAGVLIIQFIGLLGIVRGFFLLNALSKQVIHSVMSPVVFLISGAIAMNFPVFVGMIEDLFMGST